MVLLFTFPSGCARPTASPPPARKKAAGPRRYTGTQPPARANGGDTWINPKDGAELVIVNPVEFVMGLTTGDLTETPARKVQLDAYWIYRREVTNEQFAKFVKETKYLTFAESKGKGKRATWKDFAARGSLPVVRVTRDDARAYAFWAGVSLPTEAQWEKAARGIDGRAYPWGMQWSPERCANSVARRRTEPADVGSLLAGRSPFGVDDMSGNVWEWVADFFDPKAYRKPRPRNPEITYGLKFGVIRGGSYATTDPLRLRCAKREKLVVYANLPDVGFRCVWPQREWNEISRK